MNYWSMDAEAVTEALESDATSGLASAEAQDLLPKFGPNKLVLERNLTFLAVFWEEVREPMILLLVVVGILYSVWGAARDAITIFSVITVLVLVEIFTEFRAKKAVNALRRRSPRASHRASRARRYPAAEDRGPGSRGCAAAGSLRTRG